MPNINEAFPSKYLKASDLQGNEPIVTMGEVKFEPVGADKEMKAVLYFQGKAKGLVLNKTNARKITEITGSAITEEWAGHQVKLYETETQYGGDMVECIRIKAVTKPKMAPMSRQAQRPAQRPASPAPPPPSEEPDYTAPLTDEDIPF